jgi:hypothetical protein
MSLLPRLHPFERVVFLLHMRHCIGWLYYHVIFSHATYMKILVPPYVDICEVAFTLVDSYLFATNKYGACLCDGGGKAHHGGCRPYSTHWQLHLVSYYKSAMSHILTDLSVMSRHVILVNAHYSFCNGVYATTFMPNVFYVCLHGETWLTTSIHGSLIHIIMCI